MAMKKARERRAALGTGGKTRTIGQIPLLPVRQYHCAEKCYAAKILAL